MMRVEMDMMELHMVQRQQRTGLGMLIAHIVLMGRVLMLIFRTLYLLLEKAVFLFLCGRIGLIPLMIMEQCSFWETM